MERREAEQRTPNPGAGTAVQRADSAGEPTAELVPPPQQRYPVRLRQSLRQLVHARELVLTFVERDLRLRYRQAALGAAWAILQPLLLMVVFSLVFGRIAHVGSEGVPYPLFSYTALLPWGFFSGAIGYGTTSIVLNATIVRKIALPREVFPLSSVISAAIDFAVSSLILLGMLVAYGYRPRLTWLAYPPLILILAMFTTAATLVVSMITVYFRDTRYAVPTLLMVALYVTPIAYPLAKAREALSPGLRSVYPYLNPLVPLMDGFRRTLLHGRWPQWGPVSAAFLGAALLLAMSYRWYKRLDPGFADVI